MKKQIDLINEAAKQLVWAFDSQMRNYGEMLIDQCHAEEREHRGFATGFTECHTSDTISAKQAAKLFAVKRVSDYLLHEDKWPTVKDYLHMQKSCFTAAAMVAEFRAGIEKAWAGLDIKGMAELNYTDFVKVKKDEPAVEYQPKTGAKCSCKTGIQRDNCPTCEGTGMVIDFAKIRNRH